MFWIFFGILVAVEATKLDNTYLPPPPGAKESGGAEGALQVPLEPPYVDSYTPSVAETQAWKPGTRSLSSHGKATNTKPEDKYLENGDEVSIPNLEKGRFISGSYSYTGPDNVLVTVTYKADDRKDRDEDAEEDDEGQSIEEEEEETGRDLTEEDDEDSIVPTPSSLPAELARAFDFHKNKRLEQDGKTNRPKKPVKKFNKNKGQHGQHGHRDGETGGQFGMKIRPHHGGHNQISSGSGYQYPPQNQYGPPTIHQGYSYPKYS